MYNVMVVEDSKPIMRDIIKKLESIDDRLKIVDTSSDGVEALEKLKTINVDILLTDIRMPLMDGLQLIEQAKKFKPGIECIIISGYNDFEYARQAIKLQVTEYILKPVETKNLRDTITNVIKKISIQSYLRTENILQNLILNNNSEIDNPAVLSSVKKYVVIIIRLGLTRKSNLILEKSLIKQYYSPNDHNTWIVGTGYSCEAAIIFEVSEGENPHSAVNDVWEFVHDRYPIVNVMVSSVYNDICNLGSIYDELSNLLSSCIIIGKSQIYFEENQNELYSMDVLSSESIEVSKKLSVIVKSRQFDLLKSEFLIYLNEWELKSYPFIFIRRFLTIILEELDKVVPTPDNRTFTDIYLQLELLLKNCLFYKDIYENIIEYIDVIQLNLEASRRNSTNELLNSIDAYIKSNVYGSINLADISKRFMISTSYLIRLMNVKFKQSPMDYYMNLKIDEAKRLLKLSKNMLIKDISDSLGFSDQHYFSKVFKSHVGMSPVEFRDKNK